MRTTILTLLLAASTAVGAAQSAADGTWNFVLNSPMGTVTAKVDMHAEGEALTGTFAVNGNSWPMENGTIKGDTISFTLNRPGASTGPYEMLGTIKNDEVTGKAAAMGATVDWSMTRVK